MGQCGDGTGSPRSHLLDLCQRLEGAKQKKRRNKGLSLWMIIDRGRCYHPRCRCWRLLNLCVLISRPFAQPGMNSGQTSILREQRANLCNSPAVVLPEGGI